MAWWQRLRNVFRRRQVDADFFQEIEATLLAADVGPALTQEWVAAVRPWKTVADVARIMRERMLAILPPVARDVECPAPSVPRVIMIVGVNGVGKTTTIAKLAYHEQQQGQRPLLVAGDTFRAAAVEQLQIWAERLQIPMVSGASGGDAAAVAFDGVKAAIARDCDVVLIDTAGRLHTKIPLMEELAKVQRVIGKALPGAPHECWCVLDATTGRNACAQVRQFHEALQLTGLIITKLDGSAKAGTIFSIGRELPLPVCFVGCGERMQDLCRFSPEAFIHDLLGDLVVAEASSTRS